MSVSNKILVVTGMHRSGTSMSAGLLNAAGVCMGSSLVGAAKGNIHGHFEDVDFHVFHRRALRANGLSDSGFWGHSHSIGVSKELSSHADRLIDSRRSLPLWGWKEPRTTLFLDFWLNRLPEAYYLFLYRSPEGVVDSLFRRGTDRVLLDNPMLAVDAWLGANRRVVDFIRRNPSRSLLVHCEAVVKNPRHFLEMTSRFVGQSLVISESPQIFPEELRASESLSERRASLERSRPDVVRLYEELQQLAHLPLHEGDKHCRERSGGRLVSVSQWMKAVWPAADEEQALESEEESQWPTVESVLSELKGYVTDSTAVFQQLECAISGLTQGGEKGFSIDNAHILLRIVETGRGCANQCEQKASRLSELVRNVYSSLIDAQSECERLKEVDSELRSYFATERSEILALCADLQKSNEHLIAESVDLARELDCAKENLQMFEGLKRQHQEEISTLSEQLRRILNSRSWRLTKMLRDLSGCIVRRNHEGPSHPVEISCERDETYCSVSRLFDRDWYLEIYPDVAAAGVDPVQHYIECGAREGRNPNRFFDTKWYLERYVDVAASGVNPVEHYVRHGAKEGRNPTQSFDCKHYLLAHPDVARAGVEPFQHFVETGWKEGRVLQSPQATQTASLEQYRDFLVEKYDEATSRHAGFVDLDDTFSFLRKASDPQVVAFYLPQFHPIPENDAWWGKGFTEWTNVTKALPQFVGHQQPHLPIDVGFYDLRSVDVLKRQVELAVKFGISAFCFHYYWFSGKRLLEKPLDLFVNTPELPLNFCLCWANENWTRRWDGKEQDILIGQAHSPSDDINVARDFARYFSDPRYIRVGEKPLLIVYRLELFPDANQTIERWRSFFRDEYGTEIFIAAVRTFGRDVPIAYDVNAVVEFPPHNVRTLSRVEKLKTLNPDFTGTVYDYEAIVREKAYLHLEDRTVFKGVFPGWDNTARKGADATIFHGSTPALYKEWLKDVVLFTKRHNPPDAQLVFVNAWNEWAEGAHLEPDRICGYGNLEATADAILEARDAIEDVHEITSCRNREIYQERWGFIHKLFGDGLNRAEAHFLADYVGLLQAASRSTRGEIRFYVQRGCPCCFVNGRELYLTSRPALSALADAVTASRDQGPFCFVVLQFNKPELTIGCVAALKKLNRVGREIRIVVVDNGSTAQNREITRKAFSKDPEISIIFNEENKGFAQGNNLGYRYSRETLGASFVCILNNDVVIEDKDFLKSCVSTYRNWSYSVLGPDIVTRDGRRENPYCDWILGSEEWAHFLNQCKESRGAYQLTGQAKFQKCGSSSPESGFVVNPILQGAIFVASPLFVERHQEFLYGEEFLLAANALVAGDLLLYARHLAVIHQEGASTNQLPTSQKMLLGYDNAIRAMEIAADLVEANRKKACSELCVTDVSSFDRLFDRSRNNILLDLFFCQPGYHGAGEYGKTVFRELVAANRAESRDQMWVALDPELFIDPWVWELCAEQGVYVIAVKNYDHISTLVNKDCFASFFCPALVVYTGYEYMKRVGGDLPFSCTKTRVVGCIHDLRDVELALQWRKIQTARRVAASSSSMDVAHRVVEAEALEYRRHAERLLEMYRRIVRNRSVFRIVTDSRYTGNSFKVNFGDLGAKLRIMYAPMKVHPNPEPFEIAGLDFETTSFALVLHGSRYEKNAISAVRAFDRVVSECHEIGTSLSELRMLLVGVESLADIGIQDVNNPERFIFVRELRPAHLEFLYQQAKFLFYISFNEGFGYPPLEAMRYGTPSLVSNVTSIPEICGDAAIYCDPFDLDSICDGIRKVASQGIDRDIMEARYAAVRSKQMSDLRALIEDVLNVDADIRSETVSQSAF
jgi:GT2 family glycosyltransferase